MVFDQSCRMGPMPRQHPENGRKTGKFTQKITLQTTKEKHRHKAPVGASSNAPDCGLMRPVWFSDRFSFHVSTSFIAF
jgi:hypothetical protein